MKTIIRIIVLSVTINLGAQNGDFVFPDDALGIYKGDLVVENSNGKEIYGMEFHLQPTDSLGNYMYKIVYIADGNRQERNYNLIAKDTSRGEYVVDENNGILLPAKLFGNRLYSIFEVQNSLLITTETFFEDYMLFEIVFSNTSGAMVSGATEEDVPKVTSYPVTVSQRAKLIKLKN